MVNCLQLTGHCDGRGNVVIRQSNSRRHWSDRVLRLSNHAVSAPLCPIFNTSSIMHVSLNSLHSVSGSLPGPLRQQNLIIRYRSKVFLVGWPASPSCHGGRFQSATSPLCSCTKSRQQSDDFLSITEQAAFEDAFARPITELCGRDIEDWSVARTCSSYHQTGKLLIYMFRLW